MSADNIGLNGLWFHGQKYYAMHLDDNCIEKYTPVFDKTVKWLDIYFSGSNPEFNIPIHFIGTDFQKEIWHILCSIPYGNTITYGEIAKIISFKRNIPRMSAHAVGRAVGKNRISIIVPCHRVIGSNGTLTGYAGGIWRKAALLKSEKNQNSIDNVFTSLYNIEN